MKAVFGAVVSIVLLFIYVYLVYSGVQAVLGCVEASSCTTASADAFNDRMASSMSLIGGLVAALVIAELAATKPGQAPAARLLATDQQRSATAIKVLQGVTGVYLTVWLLAGLTAFFIGYLQHPGVLPPLADLGQAWLGIAVGAGYAYFGIDQP